MRHAAARAFLAMAIVGIAWAAWLAIAGGVDVTIAGVRLTSNEPLRPFAVANVAFAIYVWLGPGVDWLWTWLRRVGALLDHRIAATILAVVVSAIGIRYATTVAGGADAYGYVSQADLWLEGDLVVEQPWVAALPWPNAKWTAAPLGYRPVETEGAWAIVPTYSPGLPLLFAGAKAVFGHRAMFWVVPVTGGLLVLATYGIGRRLGSSGVGLAAAWLAATSPIVLFMIMPPMTDVPVAAAWAGAVFFSLGPRQRDVFLAGLAGALAILIRPNLAMLALPIAWWVLVRWNWRAALLFCAGLLPSVVATAAIFTYLYGSPLTSGYGGLGDAFGWGNVIPNVRNYTLWLVESQTAIALLGVVALLLPATRVWPWARDRRAVISMSLISALVALQYLTYLAFDTWWFLRFFLPAWPYLCLGLATMLLAGTRRRGALVAVLSVWLVVVLGLYTFRTASKLAAFGSWEGERTYPEVAHLVRDTIPENSIVFTLIHSGALRYYGGRMTLRFDSLDSDWLDKAVEWLAARGVRPYALLEPWEVPEFERRFAGQRAASSLSTSAVVIYKGINTIGLYDLARRPEDAVAARLVPRQDPKALRDVPPAPPPILTIR